MGNSFGDIFRLTTFGESHGDAIGGVIDGCPSGLRINVNEIQRQLGRRRPGQSSIVTQRRENDMVTFLSGIFDGVTTGTPIGFLIPNSDHHSADYDEMRHLFRPSHADYTYAAKYGVRDHRGGGRSSARETASRVVGGAVAMQVLSHYGVEVMAYTSSVGDIDMSHDTTVTSEAIDANAVRCPDAEAAVRMEHLIESVKRDGDTIGGVVTCVVRGCPIGVGQPVFDKLQARLAAAMMSINAVKGFEYGMGFDGCRRRGSEMIDAFTVDDNKHISTETNHSGGIQGGISNGMPIVMRVAFKPVATLLRPVETVDDSMNRATLRVRGRHDACVVPRAVPVVEAMAAMTVLDMLLIDRASRI